MFPKKNVTLISRTRDTPNLIEKCSSGLVFCGLQSDAQFATWLLDNLTGFVQAELVKHLLGKIGDTGERRLITASFAMGCTARILNVLVEQSATVMASNSRALVVSKPL